MGRRQRALPEHNPYLMMPQFTQPPDLAQYQGLIPQPQTARQKTRSALQAERILPEMLRITQGVLSPEDRARYEQDYAQNYLRPNEEALKTELMLQGRDTSSFGGAALGQLLAQGASEKLRAGEGLQESRLNQRIAARQSFYGNEGQLAETADARGIARGQTLAELMQRNAAMQNQFDLGRYGQFQDSYNQGYRMNTANIMQQNQNRSKGLLGLLGLGAQGAGAGLGWLAGQPSLGSAMGSIGSGFGRGIDWFTGGAGGAMSQDPFGIRTQAPYGNALSLRF